MLIVHFYDWIIGYDMHYLTQRLNSQPLDSLFQMTYIQY